MMNGSKGAVLVEKKIQLKQNLKMATEDRDRYEGYFNQAQYELMKKDTQIKALEAALVSIIS